MHMTFFANVPLFTDTYTNSVSWLLWIVLRRCKHPCGTLTQGVLNTHPGMVTLGQMVRLVLGVLKKPHTVFLVARAAYSLTSRIQIFPLPNILTSVCLFANDSHFDWGKLESSFSFVCIIPDRGSWSRGRKRACVCLCSLLLTVDVSWVPAVSCSCHCHFPAMEN